MHTFDIKAQFKDGLLGPHRPNLTYHEVSALVDGGAPAVLDLLARPGVTVLYCDNGDKQREVELYAKHLRVGSILGVHDYNSEIMGSWVEPFVADLGFEKLGHEQMEAMRTEWYPEPMTRFWLRR